jgi:hypothetical protein
MTSQATSVNASYQPCVMQAGNEYFFDVPTPPILDVVASIIASAFGNCLGPCP